APAAVVLEAAVDAVRRTGVHGNVVELPQGQVIQELPVGAPVVADVDAAVSAEHEVPAVPRVDPQVVQVGMHSLVDPLARKGPAAVAAAAQDDPQRVDGVLVVRVTADDGEVERALVEAVDARPAFAAVVGTIHAPGRVAIGALEVLDVRRLPAQWTG